MNCPNCKSTRLIAMKLETGLPAHGCKQCGGAVIPLLYYRDWAERFADTELETDHSFDAQLVAENDSKTALHCPKCTGLMTKYKITGCTHNRLELCDACDEAWLDGGEWELLKALQLSKNIPDVFTQVWQNKISKEQANKQLKDRYSKIIGAEDIEKVEAFRNWINEHKNRAEILFYIKQQ
jgi:Zn-finger nucleic acid-binding protein